MNEKPRLRGAWGESVARRHALWRGATLVDHNVRAHRGEIDLVLRHWPPPHLGVWVFAEVKARRAGLEAALEAVGPHKQRRVVLAAEEWLYRQGLDRERTRVRFDVFAITVDAAGRPRVRWIQDAFGGAEQW